MTQPRRDTAGAFYERGLLRDGLSENPAARAGDEDEPCDSVGQILFTYLSY
jgi:hypothetical protein